MMNDGGRLGENDGNGIEPDLIPGDARFGSVATGSSGDVSLFGCVDGAIGRTKLRGTAGFHFDEDNNVAVSGHDVNFGFTASRTIVPGQNRKPGPAKVPVSVVFSAPAESRFRRQAAALPELSGSIAYFPEELPRSDGPS